MNIEPIRIIVVDDHQLVRESWKYLLQVNPRFKVIAECADGESAIEAAIEHKPDIILLDMNMSPMNGLQVTEKAIEIDPTLKIIGLSVNNQPMYAQRMLELGAQGYLTKTSTLEEINNGIMTVHEGKKYVCHEVRKHLVGEF
jgi:DNA-binding NarL/FixJ family response regulator